MEEASMHRSLSQLEYLQKKYQEVLQEINDMESQGLSHTEEYKELLFKAGKMYSEMELLKRVPAYKDNETIIVKERVV
jgi:hypothetical protein